MAIIFITGMSGVGKTSVLEHLALEDYHVVETDAGYTDVIETDEGTEIGLDEAKIQKLIDEHQDKNLFISGCYANQGKFYQYFDQIVLLTADLDVMFERIDQRTTHNYGKNQAERDEILANHAYVLPLLRKGSDLVIDTTTLSIQQVAEQLIVLVNKETGA